MVVGVIFAVLVVAVVVGVGGRDWSLVAVVARTISQQPLLFFH